MSQLIDHPEYNSTLILRSEKLSDISSNFPAIVPRLDNLRPLRCIHRKLLPRRPGRDEGIEQYCTLYGATSVSSQIGPEERSDANDDRPSTAVITPIIPEKSPLPYYHPQVSHLALRYLPSTSSLRIEFLPLSDSPIPATDPSSRLYRTSLSLLDTVHRYGWGALTSYKKRVLHDCLVPRDDYQDLYLVMKKRWGWVVDQWKEVTDPLKHVFEASFDISDRRVLTIVECQYRI